MDDGTRVVLPLISTSVRRVFKKYVSMKPGVYGGPVTDGRPLQQGEIDAILRTVISPRTAQISITGNPLGPCRLPHQFQVIEDFTQILDLRKGFDIAYRNWSKGHRWAPRKAQREGISVRPASTEAEVLKYFRCYQDSLRRWGDRTTSSYPITLFLNMFERRGDNAQLWLAFWKGIVVAGSVVFYHGRHAVYWHGAALEEFFDKYPNNLLQYEIIKDSSSRGIEFYDFNPSGSAGSLEGVVKFKSHFGANKYPINRWHWDSPILKALDSARHRLGVHRDR
ncbi:MAG: GNAT family N-acetyltransferase [Promethearchaeota archaeon]